MLNVDNMKELLKQLITMIELPLFIITTELQLIRYDKISNHDKSPNAVPAVCAGRPL